MPEPVTTANDDAKKADDLAAAKKAEEDAKAATGKTDDKPVVKKEPEDLLDAIVTGDDVPDKFKGKTLREVLTSQKDLEGELTKAKTEIGHWQNYAEEKEAAEKKPVTPAYDPLEHLDEETAKAVSTIVGYQMRPVVEALAVAQEERVRLIRPDYDKYKERAQQIYQQLPHEYKMHPNYGLDWAYKMAKVEKEPTPDLPIAPLPHMGPSAAGIDGKPEEPTLTDAEKHIAGKMDMTEKEYIDYKDIKDPEKMKKE